LRAELKRVKRDTDSSRSVVAAAEDIPQALAAATSGSTRAKDSSSRITEVPSASHAEVGPALPARRWKVAVAAVVVAALVGGGLFWRSRHGQQLVGRDTILVADFINTTGAPVFDGALKKALTIDLEQSPYLNVFPEQEVRETLKFMGRPVDERITSDVAREICQRNGIKGLLTGSITSIGNQYIVVLEAVNASSGESLAQAHEQANGKEKVLPALDMATSTMRGKLGESLASLQKYDKPLEQATTSSLEALKAFTLGEQRHVLDEDVASIPFYEEATELDPNFALAFARLGTVYRNTGQQELSEKYEKLAFDLKDRASEREKLYITAHYYTDSGQLQKGIASWELYKQTYSRDDAPTTNLADLYTKLGQFDKALENALEAVRQEPDSSIGYGIAADAYLGMGRLDEAKTIANAALQRRAGGTPLHELLSQVAALQGDIATQQREDALIKSSPAGRLDLLLLYAGEAASHGQLRKSKELAAQGQSLARQMSMGEVAARAVSATAIAEAAFDLSSQAKEHAAEALSAEHSRDILLSAAFALALAGDDQQAHNIVAHRPLPANTEI
jgi:tetratricopeptide (TPR) repeat protein